MGHWQNRVPRLALKYYHSGSLYYLFRFTYGEGLELGAACEVTCACGRNGHVRFLGLELLELGGELPERLEERERRVGPCDVEVLRPAPTRAAPTPDSRCCRGRTWPPLSRPKSSEALRGARHRPTRSCELPDARRALGGGCEGLPELSECHGRACRAALSGFDTLELPE